MDGFEIPQRSSFPPCYPSVAMHGRDRMLGRREFITLLGGAAAGWPLAARAQQLSPDRPIVGVLAPQSQTASARNIEAFRKGLRDLGYVEGRNITLEIRYGDGLPERLPQLAAELVALKPAVIRAGSTAGLVAVHNATQTIPLVGATLEDPIALGLVKSISRPGTNVTGTWIAGDDALVSKRLGLLKDVVPGVSRVAAIVNPGDSSDTPPSSLAANNRPCPWFGASRHRGAGGIRAARRV